MYNDYTSHTATIIPSEEGGNTMPSLVQMQAGDSTVLIAVSGEPDVAAVTSIDERIAEVSEALRSRFKVIRQIAEDLVEALKAPSLPVKTAELEFGLGATGKGKLYVVETSVDATFKVKLTLALAREEPLK